METLTKTTQEITNEMVKNYNTQMDIGIKLFDSVFNIKSVSDAAHKQLEFHMDIQKNTLESIMGFVGLMSNYTKNVWVNKEATAKAGHQYQNTLNPIQESKNGDAHKPANQSLLLTKKAL